jgi:hypothetical protein
VGLSLADLALNGGICILHLGDTTWTKKVFKWAGRYLAEISAAPGPGRPPRDAPLSVLQQVARLRPPTCLLSSLQSSPHCQIASPTVASRLYSLPH